MPQSKHQTISQKKQLHRKTIRNIQLNTLFKQKRSSILANEQQICKMDLEIDTRQINDYNQKHPDNQDYRHNINFQNQNQRHQNIINNHNPNANNANNSNLNWNHPITLLKMNNNQNKYKMNQGYYQPYQQAQQNYQFKNILSNQKILQNFHKITPQNVNANLNLNKREVSNDNQNFNNPLNYHQKNQLLSKINKYEQKNNNFQHQPQPAINYKNHQTRIKSPINKNRQENQIKMLNQPLVKPRQITNKNTNNYFLNQLIYKKRGHIKIFQKLLGKGTYGSVYLGFHQLYNFKVAVKEIQKSQIGASKGQIQCLQKLNHQHIIRLYQTFEDENFVYLVLELATDNLREYLKKIRNQNLHQDAIKQKHMKIAKMLILGMDYLHENGVIHRDLKLQNVLIKDQKVKICDFGLARNLSKIILIQVINETILDQNLQVQSVKCGTPYTMAPQIYLHTQNYKPTYTFKSDIYSLGVILHQMFYFYHPFDMSTTKLKTLSRIFVAKRFGWIDKIIDGALCEVNKRISWKQIMKILDSCQDPKKQSKNNQIQGLNYEQSITFKETKQQKYRKEFILKANEIHQKIKIKQEIQHQKPQKEISFPDKNIKNKMQIQIKKQPKLQKQPITKRKIETNKKYQYQRKSFLISNPIVEGYKRINEVNKNSNVKKIISQNLQQKSLKQQQKQSKKVQMLKVMTETNIPKVKDQQKKMTPLIYEALMLIIIFVTVWSVMCLQM